MALIDPNIAVSWQEAAAISGSNDNNLQSQIGSAMSGSPLPATTVAAMTDHTRLYVYVGTESGYVSGHLYYWNGSTWIDSNVVYQATEIADKTVTPQKLDRVYVSARASRNLVDLSAITKGYYVNYTNGQLGSNVGYVASDWIPVQPGADYRISGSPDQGAYYNSAKQYISGFTGSSVFNTQKTPATAAYIRVSIQNANIGTAQVEAGATITKYESYGGKLNPSSGKIDESFVETSSAILVGGQGKNLFDAASVVPGYYINNTTGLGSAHAGYNASAYIPVQPSAQYTLSALSCISGGYSGIEQGAYYNTNKSYLSGFTGAVNAASLTLTTPATAAYIRVSVRDDQLDNYQIEAGSSRTPYDAPGAKITDKNISAVVLDAILTDIPIAKTISVRQNGTGDYTSIASAMAAVGSTDQYHWVMIDVGPGVYAENGIVIKPYTILRGRGPKRTIINGSFPDDTDPTNIINISTLDTYRDARNSKWIVRDMRITARNERYVIHDDGMGENPNYDHRLVNVELEHYGNVGTAWTAAHAYGYGAASGGCFYAENCRMRSVEAGWHIHTRPDFADPCRNILKNCTCTGNISIKLEPLGSGQPDVVELDDCRLQGMISIYDGPWMSSASAQQYADHSEIKVYGHANIVPVTNRCRGVALQIVSASSLSVSGSAVADILGMYKSFAGDGGLQSKITGYWDISGIKTGLNQDIAVANTLGTRLGDCTTTAKTLTVTVGGTDHTVTFAQNYVSISNADIISAINAQMNGVATIQTYTVQDAAIDIVNWYGDYLNSTAAGIAAGTTVYSSDGTTLQTIGTAPIGTAAEDINPGVYGRIALAQG